MEKSGCVNEVVVAVGAQRLSNLVQLCSRLPLGLVRNCQFVEINAIEERDVADLWIVLPDEVDEFADLLVLPTTAFFHVFMLDHR